MTELEEFDVHFDRKYPPGTVSSAVRALAFHFWMEGRRSVITASGAPVEIRTIPEAQ